MAFLIPFLFFVMCNTNVLGGKVVMKDCPAGTTGVPPGGNKLIIDSVEIAGIDKEPCTFYTGETYAIEINATTNFVAKKLLYTMAGVAMGSPPINLFIDQNLCDFLISGSCDKISPGAKIAARRDQKVEGIPLFSGKMRSTIKDENMAPVYCGEFDIIVQSKFPSIPSNPFGRK